jgi:hypothetical protein
MHRVEVRNYAKVAWSPILVLDLARERALGERVDP